MLGEDGDDDGGVFRKRILRPTFRLSS
jgi:hypothetical protein